MSTSLTERLNTLEENHRQALEEIRDLKAKRAAAEEALEKEKQHHIDVAAIWTDKKEDLSREIRELEAKLAARYEREHL